MKSTEKKKAAVTPGAAASVRIAERLRDRAKVYAAQNKTTIFDVLNEAAEEFLKKRGA
jgi:hypothetical protein